MREKENTTQKESDAERYGPLQEVVGDTEATFRGVVESLSHGVMICDADGFVRYTNPSMENILGYSWAEMKGKRVYEFFFGDDPEKIAKEKRKHHERYAARLRGVSEEYEALVTKKNGEKIWLETKAAPLRDVHGNIVGSIGVDYDVTERKLLESQVIWSQKMEAVGRLAGAVAHDFNNLLTVIRGYAGLMLQKLGAEDVNRRRASAIRDATDTAYSLTQQLLTLSQRQVIQPRVLPINEVLENSEGILRGLLGEGYQIEFSLGKDLLPVKTDPSQLQQVLINLVVNSKQAMHAGGKVEIFTRQEKITTKLVGGQNGLEAGTYVVLGVRDSGEGMSEVVRSRLFEPFYSTKPEGNGLGLSTVYGIVKRHQGDIMVESVLGEGSLFKVYFPASEEPAERYVDGNTNALLQGAETVLLVEDEPGVRELVLEVLESNGYKVIEAANGLEALAALETESVPEIDLLLTDIVMPELSGFELAERVVGKFPKMPVLMMSGCTQDSTIPENITKKGFPFLAKPFSPESLLEKMREILDRVERQSSVGQ